MTIVDLIEKTVEDGMKNAVFSEYSFTLQITIQHNLPLREEEKIQAEFRQSKEETNNIQLVDMVSTIIL